MKTLLLFDIDGTLTTGESGYTRAMALALKRIHGIEVDIDSFPHHGLTDRLIFKSFLDEAGITDHRMEACFCALSDIFIPMLPNGSMTTLPGVPELLKTVAENPNVIIGHVTGNIRIIADAKMNHCGLKEFFLLGGYGDEEHNERFELALSAIHQAETRHGFDRRNDEAIILGDTPRDIRAGKKAGIMTVGVATGRYTVAKLLAEDADLVVRDLASGMENILNLIV